MSIRINWRQLGKILSFAMDGTILIVYSLLVPFMLYGVIASAVYHDWRSLVIFLMMVGFGAFGARFGYTEIEKKVNLVEAAKRIE